MTAIHRIPELSLELSSASRRLLPMRTARVFLLAGVLAVSTVVQPGAAQTLGAPETCTEHFRGCHASCVRKQSEDASGESCRHQCQVGLRRCLSTGCAHGMCGFTRN